MKAPVLELCMVSSGYHNKEVISNISFSLFEGERLLVLGNNGSGKSTLLKTIARIINDNSGDVSYKGISLNDKRTDELPSMGISYFKQGGLVIPTLTIAEHLILALKGKHEADKDALLKRAYRIFPQLESKNDVRAGNLSGGQRLALSCAVLICQDTNLWLLDEPLAGLDREKGKVMTKFVNKEINKTMVIVEHSETKINYSKILKMDTDEG